MSWVEDLFKGLTEPQAEAVGHLDGPLLVLAGPGSGKTTVVTRRVANLVANGVPPWQVLALTFTNKAAAEMRDRIAQRLPPDVPGLRGLTVSTFHSFSARILRRHAEEGGRTPGYTIYDASDQRDAIKRAITASDLSTSNWRPVAVAAEISHAKNRLEGPEAFTEAASDFYSRTVARIYREYDRILRDADAVDFDDLLRLVADLLRRNADVRAELQDRYRYLLIDEYQDTNHAQFVIANELASAHRNICVVGDPDQSIYGWRGADVTNILEFETHYADARVIPLGQNFRSTGHIVETAAALIEHNRHRKPKRLFTELGDGARPSVVVARDEHGEARCIARELRERSDAGIPWREMAILYRINALSRVLEEVLRGEAIPYVIARGTAFYDRKEVKDALAYLRLVANPRDDVSLRRIVNMPARGIGKTSMLHVESAAIHRGVPLLAAMREARSIDGLTARAANAMESFVGLVDGWRAAARDEAGTTLMDQSLDLGALVDAVVRESGLEKMYAKSRLEEDQERAENLAELVSAAAQFEPASLDDGEMPIDPEAGAGRPPDLIDDVRAFLESVALVSDADAIDPARGAVTLMTLHTAKGLEFDVVAIAGLEDGLLPHSRSIGSELELEEERRLCFVGITRARRHLLLTHAMVRTHRGVRERTIPSTFLRELPESSIDIAEGPDPFDPYDEPAWQAEYERDTAAGGYYVGCLVRHPTFGVGRIEALTPRPRGSAVRVVFQTGGEKTLILEYAKLELIEQRAPNLLYKEGARFVNSFTKSA